MAYDALVESVRLIETRVTAQQESLTRRHRFRAVGVDVDGDFAGTVFIRRAHGGAEWDYNLLSRCGGSWRLHGGGGGGLDNLDVLKHEFSHAELGGYDRAHGGAGSLVEASDGNVSRDRWVQLAVIETAPSVVDILLSNGRIRPRPTHGYITVVWEGRTPLRGELRGDDGRGLSTVELGDLARH